MTLLGQKPHWPPVSVILRVQPIGIVTVPSDPRGVGVVVEVRKTKNRGEGKW